MAACRGLAVLRAFFLASASEAPDTAIETAIKKVAAKRQAVETLGTLKRTATLVFIGTLFPAQDAVAFVKTLGKRRYQTVSSGGDGRENVEILLAIMCAHML